MRSFTKILVLLMLVSCVRAGRVSESPPSGQGVASGAGSQPAVPADRAEFGSVDWAHLQNNAAEIALDRMGSRKSFALELQNSSGNTDVKDVAARGARVFVLSRPDAAQPYRLSIRDGNTALAVVSLDETGGTIRAFEPSPNGSTVAVVFVHGQDERPQIKFFDVDERQWLAHVVYGGEAHVAWLGEDALAYWVAGPESRFEGSTSRLLKLDGTPRDLAVFGPGTPASVTARDMPRLHVNAASPFVVGYTGIQSSGFRLYVARRMDLVAGMPRWRSIAAEEKIGAFDIRGGQLYVLSHTHVSRGQVIEYDIASGKRTGVTYEDAAGIIKDIHATAEGLYLSLFSNGRTELAFLLPDQQRVKKSQLPAGASIDQVTIDPLTGTLVVAIASWIAPPRYAAIKGGEQTFLQISGDEKPEFELESFELSALAGDREHVPITVVRRKDLADKGRLGVKVVAFGSFGYTYTPRFLYREIPWLRRGGVMAFAHVRGGGYFGERWHQAGRQENKDAGISDYLACVGYLRDALRVRNVIAKAEGIGALVVASAVLRRPDLFSAAVFEDGVFDIGAFLERAPVGSHLRTEFTRSEASDSTLQRISPTWNIPPSGTLPPMLISVRWNDPRSRAQQVETFVRRLQERGHNPYLRVNFADGYEPSPVEELQRNADEHAFVFAVTDAADRGREPSSSGRRPYQPEHAAGADSRTAR
jgi:prolyl oligopeptidase